MIYIFWHAFIVESENSEVFVTYIYVLCSSDNPKNTVIDQVFVTKIYKSTPFTCQKSCFPDDRFLWIKKIICNSS